MVLPLQNSWTCYHEPTLVWKMAFGNPAFHHVMSQKEELNGFCILLGWVSGTEIYMQAFYPPLGWLLHGVTVSGNSQSTNCYSQLGELLPPCLAMEIVPHVLPNLETLSRKEKKWAFRNFAWSFKSPILHGLAQEYKYLRLVKILVWALGKKM